MTPKDRDILNRSQLVNASRLPGHPDGFRFTALGDVTGQAPQRNVTVYFDWTPTTGLSRPVVVVDPEQLKVLQGGDTSVALVYLHCMNVNTSVIPGGEKPSPTTATGSGTKSVTYRLTTSSALGAQNVAVTYTGNGGSEVNDVVETPWSTTVTMPSSTAPTLIALGAAPLTCSLSVDGQDQGGTSEFGSCSAPATL